MKTDGTLTDLNDAVPRAGLQGRPDQDPVPRALSRAVPDRGDGDGVTRGRRRSSESRAPSRALAHDRVRPRDRRLPHAHAHPGARRAWSSAGGPSAGSPRPASSPTSSGRVATVRTAANLGVYLGVIGWIFLFWYLTQDGLADVQRTPVQLVSTSKAASPPSSRASGSTSRSSSSPRSSPSPGACRSRSCAARPGRRRHAAALVLDRLRRPLPRPPRDRHDLPRRLRAPAGAPGRLQRQPGERVPLRERPRSRSSSSA